MAHTSPVRGEEPGKETHEKQDTQMFMQANRRPVEVPPCLGQLAGTTDREMPEVHRKGNDKKGRDKWLELMTLQTGSAGS